MTVLTAEEALSKAQSVIDAQRIRNAEFDAAAAAAAAKRQAREDKATDFVTMVLERSNTIGPVTKQVYAPFVQSLATALDKKLNQTTDVFGVRDIALSFMYDVYREPAFIAATEATGQASNDLFWAMVVEFTGLQSDPSSVSWNDLGEFTQDEQLALHVGALTFGELFVIHPELFLPVHLD